MAELTLKINGEISDVNKKIETIQTNLKSLETQKIKI